MKISPVVRTLKDFGNQKPVEQGESTSGKQYMGTEELQEGEMGAGAAGMSGCV